MSQDQPSTPGQFLSALFGDHHGEYLRLVAIDRNKKAYQRFLAIPDELDQIDAIVMPALDSVNWYFGANSYKNEGKGNKEFVSDSVRHVHADLDTTDPDTLLVAPSILLESSPGRYQALWLLKEPLTHEETESINYRIFAYHMEQGTDPCWDVGHLLRIPFTKNHKDDDTPSVKLIKLAAKPLNTSDFAKYPDAVPPTLGWVDLPVPDASELEEAQSIIARHRHPLGDLPFSFPEMWVEVPPADWSGHHWHLIKMCADAGLTREETYSVARAAPSNHYRRDGRPDAELWKDVIKAHRDRLAEDIPNEDPYQDFEDERQEDEDQKERLLIEKEKQRLRVQAIARRELAAENWTEPEDNGSLDDQFENPAEDPGFLVYSLFPAEGIHQVVAQWKAGKTTLIDVNLAACLASGEPFLGWYQVKFDRGNVGIWNLEVSAGMLQRWLFARGLTADQRKRIFPLHLRGSSVDLQSPTCADWAVKWLKKHETKVWIIDPLSKLYRGKENDSTEFNEWWRTLEDIMRRAGVDVTIIVHHAGHASVAEADGIPRSRGTSAMMGNPDVLVSYRHSGGMGEKPPDSRRYLSAFGRNVDFPEITIDFEDSTQRLYQVSDSGGRDSDRTRRQAVVVHEKCKLAGQRLKTGDLKKALGTGREADKVAAIEYAVAMQWITVSVEGVTKWHEVGPVEP